MLMMLTLGVLRHLMLALLTRCNHPSIFSLSNSGVEPIPGRLGTFLQIKKAWGHHPMDFTLGFRLAVNTMQEQNVVCLFFSEITEQKLARS